MKRKNKRYFSFFGAHVFKGAKKYKNAKEVSEAIDAIGGILTLSRAKNTSVISLKLQVNTLMSRWMFWLTC